MAYLLKGLEPSQVTIPFTPVGPPSALGLRDTAGSQPTLHQPSLEERVRLEEEGGAASGEKEPAGQVGVTEGTGGGTL